MKHTLFKVREGRQNDWRSWCVYLCAHEKEALETMREENCVYERCVMFERGGDFYVVGSAHFNGDPLRANLYKEINVQHKQHKEHCLGKAVAVFTGEFMLPPNYEMLYTFEVL